MLGNHPNVLGGNTGQAAGGSPGSGNVTGTGLTAGAVIIGGGSSAISATTIAVTANQIPATAISVADAGNFFTATNAETVLQEVGGEIAALQAASGGGSSSTGNQLFAGGGVSLISGLDIVVSAASYSIAGTTYSSPITSLSASTADPTNPRIDVVAVNSSGAAVIITGTPAATPVHPDVDPTTQLELTFFLVAAGATSLPVAVTAIYQENTEYTMTESGGHINLASTNNPYLGTKDIEGTSVVATDYFMAQTPSGFIDLGAYDSLVMFVRNKAAWPNAKQINITARNSGTQVGTTVVLKGGQYNFDSASNFTTYQQIIIPTSAFSANGQSVNQIRWTVSGGGAAIGFYFDQISLQGGAAPVVDSTRTKWRGTYSASLLYNINDVVVYNGVQYVCIQSGVNNTPSSSSTYWQISAQQVMYGTDAGASDTYAVTFSPAPSAFTTGMRLSFKANTANTGACTVNPNGLGAKTIKKVAGGVTTDLADNDIRVGQIVDLVYDGTNMQMQSTLGNAASASGGSLTKIQFTATDNQPPASAFATFDTRNSFALLNFDDTTDESAVFVGILPEGTSLTTGLRVILKWTAASATSGACVWVGAWERCNTDIDSDSFATGVSATTTTSGTSGIPNTTTIDFNGTTEIDGLTVGDMFRLKITRDADNGSDTMAGDAQLLTLEVQQR